MIFPAPARRPGRGFADSLGGRWPHQATGLQGTVAERVEIEHDTLRSSGPPTSAENFNMVLHRCQRILNPPSGTKCSPAVWPSSNRSSLHGIRGRGVVNRVLALGQVIMNLEKRDLGRAGDADFGCIRLNLFL